MVCLVARAAPGIFRSEEEILWRIGLARAMSYVHAGRVLDGVAMIWPQAKLSRVGRWWSRVRALITARRRD